MPTTDPVPRPTTDQEWETHRAFYRLTVAQRDSAWREVAELVRILDEMEPAPDDLGEDNWAVLERIRRKVRAGVA